MKYLLDDIKNFNKNIINIQEVYEYYNYRNRYIKLLSQIILLTNKEKLIITPIGDCCSISYLVLFDDYNLRKLIDYKIKSFRKIDDIDEIKKEFSKISTYRLDDVKKLYLYEFTLFDSSIFKFGLVNSSNGYYDGWIELYIDKN